RERVYRCLGVQLKHALVRDDTDLVRLVSADDRNALQPAGGFRGTGHAGRHLGRVTSGVTSSNTTSTGISQSTTLGSGSIPIRFENRRTPSSRSISAVT